MSNITFDVIDTSCESADQSFFVPQIVMTTKSTTNYATLFGWDEFVPSTPPKKYRKATVNGVSERIGFTMEETPRQCAGARYTWTGSGEYSLKGVLTQSYLKNFYAQCAKQYWPVVPLQNNPNATNPSPLLFPSFFVGYCWSPDLNSCPVCDPNIVNWPFLGNHTTNSLPIDLSTFLLPPNSIAKTSTTYTAIGQFFGFFALSVPNHTSTPSGHHYNVSVGATVYDVESAFVDPPLAFPVEFIGGVEGAYVNFADATNLTAVLSEEYTDADAAANAQVVTGTGTTAQTLPRTTGFTSVSTSVVFTLKCSNLVVGKDYTVTVDLWEKGPSAFSTHTPQTYNFTAAASTNSIVDIIPTPIATHTITVQKPSISFA